MASALGINVPKVYTGVFMLGCWLGGLAGTLMPPMSVVALGSDMAVIIECFIIVVIGGLGSLPGAFIGAIILGLLTAGCGFCFHVDDCHSDYPALGADGQTGMREIGL
jgi:branched-subunit amino acid ABC-type transport system permease component